MVGYHTVFSKNLTNVLCKDRNEWLKENEQKREMGHDEELSFVAK